MSKRLPIVVGTLDEGALRPLPLRKYCDALPPRGPGNRGILEPGTASRYADQTANYLRAVESDFKVTIRAIAIDAPGCYCPEDQPLRISETALSEAKISFFSTPTRSAFDEILNRARHHQLNGGDIRRVPHANKLWMHAGFALFEVLGHSWSCLETYPFAIAHELGIKDKKSRGLGHRAHLHAALHHTGWAPRDLYNELSLIAFGDPHDRVDAYLACWVASLRERDRRAYGSGSDAIWVPQLP